MRRREGKRLWRALGVKRKPSCEREGCGLSSWALEAFAVYEHERQASRVVGLCTMHRDDVASCEGLACRSLVVQASREGKAAPGYWRSDIRSGRCVMCRREEAIGSPYRVSVLELERRRREQEGRCVGCREELRFEGNRRAWVVDHHHMLEAWCRRMFPWADSAGGKTPEACEELAERWAERLQNRDAARALAWYGLGWIYVRGLMCYSCNAIVRDGVTPQDLTGRAVKSGDIRRDGARGVFVPVTPSGERVIRLARVLVERGWYCSSRLMWWPGSKWADLVWGAIEHRGAGQRPGGDGMHVLELTAEDWAGMMEFSRGG